MYVQTIWGEIRSRCDDIDTVQAVFVPLRAVRNNGNFKGQGLIFPFRSIVEAPYVFCLNAVAVVCHLFSVDEQSLDNLEVNQCILTLHTAATFVCC